MVNITNTSCTFGVQLFNALFYIVVHCVHAHLAAAVAGDGLAGQVQVQSGVINAGEVASARWLVLLRLEAEGVHVDALAGHILVVLVRLHQVEVAAIALGEPVVAVELELGGGHGVGTALEGDGQVHAVGTTSGNTGHGACGGVTVVDDDSVGGSEGTSAVVGNIVVIGVVEPLLALVRTSGVSVNMGIGLHNPNQLLNGVVEVELNLVRGR